MKTDGLTGLCTNVLLRWLLDGSSLGDDAPRQTFVAQSLLGDRGRTFFVNDIVVAETAWIIRKKLKQDKAAVAGVIDRLLAADNVEVENEHVLRSATTAYLTGTADLADELIAHVNQAAGCSTTLTFDKDAGGSPLFKLVS